jgi:hypothetical protein
VRQQSVETRAPDLREPCAACGPHRKSAANRIRRVKAIWRGTDNSFSWYCNRCGDKGFAQASSIFAIQRNRLESITPKPKRDMAKLAAHLWSRSIAIEGSLAERYLAEGRGLKAPFPPTLRYLPPQGGYPANLIGAFGLVEELEPGVLPCPKHVTAVHLTALSDDGRARVSKRMIGPVSGQPLVLAPPNDGLGLVIAEGIEDALSLHQATGLGAWAAGSAAHMGKLGGVVPDYVACVTLSEDNNKAGREACVRLGRALIARGFEVLVARAAGARHDR